MLIRNEKLDLDRRLARHMPRAWPVFFGRFGRLTGVQRQSMPHLLQGIDVLICAATASGKTEAVCAPLIERNIDQSMAWNIIYITPTRALANDLYERLAGPLKELGLKIARRTGDHRDKDCWEAQVILTTPESFDSLLCRGRRTDGHILAPAVAVILDEIHLLYGTARGEQVKWLLKRLFRLKKQAVSRGWTASTRVQLVGLSATIIDPKRVRDEYLPGGRVITITGSREIEAVLPTDIPVSITKALPPYLEKLGRLEKVLVFCHTRRRVDDLTASLTPVLKGLGYITFAHHGSLSKRLREEAERSAREAQGIVIFATSTLEIGIDIGDIDLIVLDGPARNVGEFLQRIGRGNRRNDKTRVMTCAKNEFEAIINTAMLEAARQGSLGDEVSGPQFAVARQQIISYIFQSRRYIRSRHQVEELFHECQAVDFFQELIKIMALQDDIRLDGDGLRMGDEWVNQTGSGAIHSNIEETGGYQVVDANTGASIATGVIYNGGKGIKTGGKQLVVKGREGNRLLVRPSKKEVEEAAYRYIGRHRMKSSGQASALRHYLGLPINQWSVIIDNNTSYAFHFGGSIQLMIITMITGLLEGGARDSIIASNEFYIAIKGTHKDKPPWMGSISLPLLQAKIAEELESLENRLGRPYSNRKLPIAVRQEEIKGWLHLADRVKWIQSSPWVLLPDVGREETTAHPGVSRGRIRVLVESLINEERR